MGGRSIACLNARDRNLLGLPPRPAHRRRVRRRPVPLRLRRPADVGRAHRPTHGALDDRRAARASPSTRRRRAVPRRRRRRTRPAAGVEARRRLPLRAGPVLARRAARVAARPIDFDGPVYAGVMVVAERRDGAQARRRHPAARRSRPSGSTRSSATRRPASTSRANSSPTSSDSGAFDGVHLIPVSKYREVAANLEAHGTEITDRALDLVEGQDIAFGVHQKCRLHRSEVHHSATTTPAVPRSSPTGRGAGTPRPPPRAPRPTPRCR